jgi:hypothetical protein
MTMEGLLLGPWAFSGICPGWDEQLLFSSPVDLVTARIFVSLPLHAVKLLTSRIMVIMKLTAASICWEIPPKASENQFLGC